MPDSRPDPDQLLAQVQADAARAARGSLKVFFGYAAGVGKTYAMLESARLAKSAGRDVVVGYVEPHARPETQALLQGLEILPTREVHYRGVCLREFDLDAALARRPELLLVDELAHTNGPGSRHAKRWQDVEDLLAAGIHVWSTLNVQHIETLNDVIGQVTGVAVRETVPDHVFDAASELELVDIAPAELLARLEAGKIYISEQARRAMQSFFQKSNLTALRELSLRRAAQRIHTDVETARRDQAAKRPWATSERLLVCVGPSPTTARVIRTAKRLATALDGSWMAVAVDVADASSSQQVKQQIAENFRLAERLGAETETLTGNRVAETILDYARSRNVTKILIGKTAQPRWRRLLSGSVVDELLEHSGDIDVYVIHGQRDTAEPSVVPQAAAGNGWRQYAVATAAVGAAALLATGLKYVHLADGEANTVMLFLAAVAYVAFAWGRGPAVWASLLAVLVFDFVFVPPSWTLAVADVQYLFTFLVMLAIGLLISALTSRHRAQVANTRVRERRTSALYQLGKQLSALYGGVFLVAATAEKVAEMTGGEVVIYLRQPQHGPQLACGQDSSIARDPVSLPAAQWVIERDQLAGAGTNTLPNAVGLFLPLVGSQQTLGALAVRVPDLPRLLEPDERHFLEACASQLALALERDQLAIDASEARIHAEAEQLRSTLLASVSHDLKTPLAAIAGASSSLLDSSPLDEPTRRQLLETVADEAARLNRLLENILQMARLDAGTVPPNRDWHVIEEIVGVALQRTSRQLAQHPVSTHVDAHLPLVFVDGLLLEQVLVNLLENAARYTPSGTPIHVAAHMDGNSLRLTVSDQGPGLPAGSEERIFEKFYRASASADVGRGSGLGLAICRAIVQAHGGTIAATNRPAGGAEFVVRLPVAADAPRVSLE